MHPSFYRKYRSRSEVNYYDYIKSAEWKRKANAAKKRAGYRCQVCNDNHRLEAHHRTYERLGHEFDEDITVLCHQCHSLYEKNKKMKSQPMSPTASTVLIVLSSIGMMTFLYLCR